MTMSKRLAQLGAQSALSVAKPRGLGSCTFPYRQTSDFTKPSENSQYHSTIVQHETERLRKDLEKMRTELRSEIEEGTNKLVMELRAARYKFLSCSVGILASSVAVGIGVYGLTLSDRI